MGPGAHRVDANLLGGEPHGRLLTKPTTPNLHIEWTGLYAEPCRPEVEAVNSKLLPPRARISGIAASVVTRAVRRFRSIARSKTPRSIPSTVPGPGCPTWFQTKSSPLKRPTVSHTM